MSDEELIDRLAQQAQIDDGDRALLWQTYRRIVASTIERMAEAGRLLPPVVETRREWRIVSTENTQLDEGFQFVTVYQDEIETVDEAIAALKEWRDEYHRPDARMQFHDITHVSGGGIYYAPWREVSP